MHLMPAKENLFLPEEGQMIAVFADQHLRQQARRGQTAFLQTRRQGRHHRGQIQLHAGHIFFADEPPAQKTGRFIIQLLADFLPDAAPLFGSGFHRFRFEHFLDHRQVLRQPRRAFLPGPTHGDFGGGDDGHGGGCFHEDSRLQEQLQLRRVEPFVARTKHPAHQGINLLTEQRVLLLGGGQRRVQGDDEFA